MRQTKSQETQREEGAGRRRRRRRREEGKEDGSVSLHRETVPSLDTGESRCWKTLVGSRNEPIPALFPPGPLLWRLFCWGAGRVRGREIPLVSISGGDAAERSTRRNGNESFFKKRS